MPLPLVLLPGMNCTAALWRPVVNRLSLEGEVLVRIVDGADLDGAVCGLVETLPDRFALAGLSLGGIAAMALHRLAPERVERLALLDTSARAPTEVQQAAWQSVLDRLTVGLEARTHQEELLELLVAPAHRRRLAETVVGMGQQTGAELLARQLRIQQSRVDELPGLAKVAVPTLVLYGELDVLCPVQRHREMAAVLTGSTLVGIPGAGHLSPLEAPEPVAVALSDWLAR